MGLMHMTVQLCQLLHICLGEACHHDILLPVMGGSYAAGCFNAATPEECGSSV